MQSATQFTQLARRPALQESLPEIALIIQSSMACGQGMLRGVAGYMRSHRPWSVYVDQWSFRGPLPIWLKTWSGDGVIMQSQSTEVTSAIDNLKTPTVAVQRQHAASTLPAVVADDDAIARLAINHLAERRIQHFAYIGIEGAPWSEMRGIAFAEELRRAGHECYKYAAPPIDESLGGQEHGRAELAEWLRGIPTPMGVMAADDAMALRVLDACRIADLAVPDQIAVIGVNNDETLCNLSNPSLSSIELDYELIGFKAAQLLDNLLQGQSAQSSPIMIKPLGVEARRSTDRYEMGDPLTSQAMRFIHLNACRGISVSDVAKHCDASRKQLERRFAVRLGISPHRVIALTKLSRAKTLLLETASSLDEIARKCSFTHAPYLNAFFKKETGLTPGEYRRTSQVDRQLSGYLESGS